MQLSSKKQSRLCWEKKRKSVRKKCHPRKKAKVRLQQGEKVRYDLGYNLCFSFGRVLRNIDLHQRGRATFAMFARVSSKLSARVEAG